jgi:hypothetical protein
LAPADSLFVFISDILKQTENHGLKSAFTSGRLTHPIRLVLLSMAVAWTSQVFGGSFQTDYRLPLWTHWLIGAPGISLEIEVFSLVLLSH